MVKRTIAYYENWIFGALLEDKEYAALGGRSLANAFSDHHVQLVRMPNGQFQIVDDVNSDAYSFVDDVNIDVQASGRWSLSARQSDHVRAEIEQIEFGSAAA